MTNKYDEALKHIKQEMQSREHPDLPVIAQALTLAAKFEKHKDALKALVDAGGKATQGGWMVHQCQECHVPSDRLSFHYPIRQADGVTDIIPDENGDQDYENIGNDMVFAASSANARPILKELLEEVE